MPPQRKYTWDAENRLTTVEPTVPVEDDVQLKFEYDYMGRRVQKQVFRWNTGASAWNATAETDLRFVYDGWNVILVLDGLNSNAVTRQYTWGLDLSGTLQGAGGVGGLLAAVETQGTSINTDDKNYWFLYDGNGNVGQVLDATNPATITTAAKYEYDPYGNLIASDGTYAAANLFRFSTKWFDDGLYYYGYRYYLPRLGRWISRDPIEEQGGLNLYGFVGNQPSDMNDLLGLSEIRIKIARSPLETYSTLGSLWMEADCTKTIVQGFTLELKSGNYDLGTGAGKKDYPIPQGKYTVEPYSMYGAWALKFIPNPKGFTFIRLHVGTNVVNTEGCILVGTEFKRGAEIELKKRDAEHKQRWRRRVELGMIRETESDKKGISDSLFNSKQMLDKMESLYKEVRKIDENKKEKTTIVIIITTAQTQPGTGPGN